MEPPPGSFYLFGRFRPPLLVPVVALFDCLDLLVLGLLGSLGSALDTAPPGGFSDAFCPFYLFPPLLFWDISNCLTTPGNPVLGLNFNATPCMLRARPVGRSGAGLEAGRGFGNLQDQQGRKTRRTPQSAPRRIALCSTKNQQLVACSHKPAPSSMSRPGSGGWVRQLHNLYMLYAVGGRRRE